MKKITILPRFLLLTLILSTFTGSMSGFGTAASPLSTEPPVLLGTYILDWDALDETDLYQDVIALDEWAGKRNSLVAVLRFFDSTVGNIVEDLDLLWNSGYTPYVNMEFFYSPLPSAYQIAIGERDSAITAWAKAIASWATDGRWLYLAPLPEMNTKWQSYGLDPENYKIAYTRIQQIFSQNGVSDSAVKWAFSPNGWAGLTFESYYPGDDQIDVVGFSAYNRGYCDDVDNYWYWSQPNTTFGFSIRKLNRMAPSKPIFISQAGTTAATTYDGTDISAKNKWLQDAYNYLAIQYGVQAVIYHNNNPEGDCDWAIYEYNQFGYDGYRLGIANPTYGYLSPEELAATDLTPVMNGTNFYPIMNRGVTGSQGRILLGMYTQGWPGLQRVISEEVGGVDAWSGKRISIVGTFVDFVFTAVDDIELQLEVIGQNGYVPFLNLATFDDYFTAERIAKGEADGYLRPVAQAFARYAKNGQQAAYVALLYEMNGSGAPYGGDPPNFILAYKHIQQVFREEGVPDESIAWVFAPNGNSSAGWPEFEEYYPGDDVVDFTGFSAYQFGYCEFVDPDLFAWFSPAEAIGIYLDKIIAMAPEKPVFIAQTATTAMTEDGMDYTAKDAWLMEFFEYFSHYTQLQGIIYYNRWDAECDWAFYEPNGLQYSGYVFGVSNPIYGFFSPWQQRDFFLP